MQLNNFRILFSQFLDYNFSAGCNYLLQSPVVIVQFNYINYKPFIFLKKILSENYNFLPKGLGFSKFQIFASPSPFPVKHFK